MLRRFLKTSARAIFLLLLFTGAPAFAEGYQNPLDPPFRSDDPAWEEARVFWEKRAEGDNAQKALKVFQSLAANHPEALEPELWLCRAYYFLGVLQKSQKRRAPLLAEAIRHGQAALARAPGNFTALYWIVASYYHLEKLSGIPPEVTELAARLPRGQREIPIPADTPEWKEALALWDARVDLEKARAAAALFRKMTERDPRSLEAWLWLTRAYYWLGRSEKDPEAKKKIFSQGYEFGLEAVRLSPRHPFANYWAMCHLARYGELGTFMTKARLSLEIINLLRLVDQEDPLYYFSGVASILIWAFADTGELTRRLVPPLLGIPSDMRPTLKMAFLLEPNYFDVRVGLVKFFLSIGDYYLAREHIDYILRTPAASLAGYEAENILSQEIVRELRAEIDRK